MTEYFDKQTTGDLIQYRLKRANETLEEAKYNAAGGYYNTAVNRLYYACFYAAIALLVVNHYEVSTHKGVKVILNLNFIRTGKLENKYGIIYQQLFNYRQSGDYEDFFICDSELFNELYPKAKEFVEKLTTMVCL